MARQLSRKITAILGAAALLVVSHQTLATTLSASATMDWSGLTIEFLPNGLGYSLSDEHSSVTKNQPIFDSDSVFDWTTPLSLTESNGVISTSVNATVGTVSAITEIQGDTGALLSLFGDLGISQQYQSFSDASRSARLAISGGPGLLIVTVPVMVFASLTDSDNALEPDAFANARLNIGKVGGAGSFSSVARGACFEGECGEGGLYSDFLVAALRVQDGDVVTLQGDVFTELDLFYSVPAPVPLPPALWLLGSAVGGLGIFRGRLQKA